MIKRKTFFFHFGTTFNTPWLQKKKFGFSWTTTLTALRSWEKCSFLFHWDVHYGNIFLHDLTSLTTSLTCRKNFQTVYSPEKTCVTLKTIFLRNFSGVLHDLLPILLEEVARFVTFINLVKSYYFCPSLFSWISELTISILQYLLCSCISYKVKSAPY